GTGITCGAPAGALSAPPVVMGLAVSAIALTCLCRGLQSLTMTVQRSWRAGPLVLWPRGQRLPGYWSSSTPRHTARRGRPLSPPRGAASPPAGGARPPPRRGGQPWRAAAAGPSRPAMPPARLDVLCPLEHGGNALAAANTHGDQAVPAAGSAQFVQRLHRE